MTKQRAPLTIENALFRVLGVIGGERAADVTGRSPGYLLSLSDPDKRERLTVADAITLDLEYRASGGDGAPIFETYGLLLSAAEATRFADAHALHRRVSTLIRECGEAGAAVVIAALPAASVADRRTATREVEEAIAEMTRILPLLAPELPRAEPPSSRDQATHGPQAAPSPETLEPAAAAAAGQSP